jgi:thymidylate synthase (FAD)
MTVKLISYTKPTQEMIADGVVTANELIAYCARVSNPANQLNNDTADKLIAYLIKHKHFSPFEMVNLVFEINTTRDIARQILRHRSFSFQEFSQRYADPTQLEYVLREARLQDTKNRQNSVEVEDDQLTNEWHQRQQEVWDKALQEYKWALDKGIAKEVARAVLPEGMTPTKMYMQGSLRSWIHYLEVRSTEEGGTQKEHRIIAQEIAQIIKKHFTLPQ